jgi:acetyl esterase/lipase
MPSLRSRILYRILKRRTARVDRHAPLARRRADLEDSARFLPMPRPIEVRRAVVGDFAAEWLLPPSPRERRAVLYLHGGAFTMGSCATHRALAARIAQAAGTAALVPEFRLAPEHPFPAAIEDCTAAWRWLIANGTPHDGIVIAGDSSGGGLAISLAIALRDASLPLPAAIVCLSPWVDLELTGESLTTRADVDPLCTVAESALHASCYLGTRDPRTPLASPIHADLHGLPPILIHVGDREILLSDAVRLADRARAAGVSVELEVRDDLWHVWHLLAAYLPEGRQAIERIGTFIRKHQA